MKKSIGDTFILGKAANTATKMTGLVGNIADTTKAALSISNTRGGSALSLKVGSTTVSPNDVAPMRVNSTKRVDYLNADNIDGLDSTDFQGKYAQTVVVAKSGGDFTSVQAALDSIPDANATKHYLVWVGPDTYNERVQMKPFVDIEGAGELATRITAPGGTGFAADSSTVSGANDAELSHLTVDNSGGSSPTMTHVSAKGSGAGYNVGIVNAGSSPTMTDVSAKAEGGSNARGMDNSTSSPQLTNVRIAASGGSTENTGLYNYLHSSPTVRGSAISASGTASLGVCGLFPDDTTSVVTIENSEVKDATSTIKAEGGYKVNVGASKLDGGSVSVGTTSAVKCAGVHDENYVFSAGSTCP